MIDRKMILDSFKAVRANTIEVARDIPAEKYDFRPAEGTGNVLELFQRLLRLTEMLTNVALHKGDVKFDPERVEEFFKRFTWTDPGSVTTKEQVVEALQRSMDEIECRLMAAEEGFLGQTMVAPDGITKERLWIVNNAKEQEMAIRAQLMLIERLLGIVPHTTRRQQEREAKRKEQKAGR